jgi:hypothetical protein
MERITKDNIVAQTSAMFRLPQNGVLRYCSPSKRITCRECLTVYEVYLAPRAEWPEQMEDPSDATADYHLNQCPFCGSSDFKQTTIGTTAGHATSGRALSVGGKPHSAKIGRNGNSFSRVGMLAFDSPRPATLKTDFSRVWSDGNPWNARERRHGQPPPAHIRRVGRAGIGRCKCVGTMAAQAVGHNQGQCEEDPHRNDLGRLG